MKIKAHAFKKNKNSFKAAVSCDTEESTSG